MGMYVKDIFSRLFCIQPKVLGTEYVKPSIDRCVQAERGTVCIKIASGRLLGRVEKELGAWRSEYMRERRGNLW